MEADVGRLVREVRERLVEGGQLGRDLAQLFERARTDRPGRRPVADLVQVVGVREDERASPEIEDVELDEVDAEVDRGAEGAQRVLGRQSRSAPVADPQDGVAVVAPQVDHAAFLRRAVRSHHQESAPRIIAWSTASAAVMRETSDPELLGVDADQGVGARELPGVPGEEDLVEADEEPVEAEEDHRHGEQRDRERRERARQQPGGDGGAKPRPPEHEAEHGDRDQRDELRPEERRRRASERPACGSARARRTRVTRWAASHARGGRSPACPARSTGDRASRATSAARW